MKVLLVLGGVIIGAVATVVAGGVTLIWLIKR